MVDLGPNKVGSYSEGVAISASGLITGDAQDSTGEFGFLSSGDGTPMTKILNVIGGTTTYPLALNNSGQVTGYAGASTSYDHAFLWKNDGSPMVDLGIVDPTNIGFDESYGLAINDSGQVAGASRFQEFPDSYASVWQNGGKTTFELGTLFGGFSAAACCINASGEVAGTSSKYVLNRSHAFLWRNDGTPIHDLGTLGGANSIVNAFNDSGQVAGWSDTLRFLKPHAFVRLRDGTPMRDLGTFGGTSSQSNDINASGQVTGFANLTGDSIAHAFLWRNDGTTIQDLNALIDPTDPLKSYVTLTNGAFINDSGDILAEGTDRRKGAAFYVLQGTVLTLKPRSLVFGNQQVKTSSDPKSITISNTGAKAVPIGSVTLDGAGAGQFAVTDNCGKSLAGKAKCTVKVVFRPITKGAKSAILKVNGGGGGLRSVSLTGTGV